MEPDYVRILVVVTIKLNARIMFSAQESKFTAERNVNQSIFVKHVPIKKSEKVGEQF